MPSKDCWLASARHQGGLFVDNLKRMVLESGHIPDLAGAGNLIFTADGSIRLVDINNISPITLDASIPLDEKGYPVCDKSVEALSLIEEKIAGRPIPEKETLYRVFLNTERRDAVRKREEAFWRR